MVSARARRRSQHGRSTTLPAATLAPVALGGRPSPVGDPGPGSVNPGPSSSDGVPAALVAILIVMALIIGALAVGLVVALRRRPG